MLFRSAQSLGTDPEFLALNPDLVPLQTTLGGGLIPYIPADSLNLLWRWVQSDKDPSGWAAASVAV